MSPDTEAKMRSIVWVACGVAVGAALTGFTALGTPDRAFAQGMTMSGDSPRKVTPKRAAKPASKAKRHFYRSSGGKSCGQYKYMHRTKGVCMDARTTPPSLK
jgi:hypothetical protein